MWTLILKFSFIAWICLHLQILSEVFQYLTSFSNLLNYLIIVHLQKMFENYSMKCSCNHEKIKFHYSTAGFLSLKVLDMKLLERSLSLSLCELTEPPTGLSENVIRQTHLFNTDLHQHIQVFL